MRRRAFTLLELLMAAALSAVLMIGVLGVVSRLGSAAMASTTGDQVIGELPVESWVRLLRQDVSQAKRVTVPGDNQLTILGYSGLNASSRQGVHLPVLIQYQIQTVNNHPWLIRRQSPLDAHSNQKPLRDLVCGGIKRFELIADGKNPAAWRLRAWTADRPDPVFNRLVSVQMNGTRS